MGNNGRSKRRVRRMEIGGRGNGGIMVEVKGG